MSNSFELDEMLHNSSGHKLFANGIIFVFSRLKVNIFYMIKEGTIED